jgi:hypothetical protein
MSAEGLRSHITLCPRSAQVDMTFCNLGCYGLEMETGSTANVYSERYVAFIDILGFSSHVRQSEHSPSEAEKLVKIMDRISERWSYPALQSTHEVLCEDFRSQSFSDCTVLSEAATPKGLHYLLLMVTQFALDLLANGFLLRGGIAKGPLHHSKNAVFGPAFLKAYDLEQNIAEYPRIIVDQYTHQDFNLNPSPEAFDKHIRPDLRHAVDGPVYVDIFSAFKFAGPLPARIELNRQACRDQIQAKLDASIYVPAHYKKLQWLTSVWNSNVEEESGRHQWIVAPVQRDFEKRNERGG